MSGLRALVTLAVSGARHTDLAECRVELKVVAGAVVDPRARVGDLGQQVCSLTTYFEKRGHQK